MSDEVGLIVEISRELVYLKREATKAQHLILDAYYAVVGLESSITELEKKLESMLREKMKEG